MSVRLLCVALVGVSLVGCVPPPPPIPPPANSKALDAVLTTLLLDPNVTCEELRAAFQLEHLPLVDHPGQIGLDYNEIFVMADQQFALRVWDIRTRLNRGTVIYSIGAVGELPCYLFLASLLADNGWSVVMYEYRGFGRSTGEPDLEALDDDLSAVVDYVLATRPLERVTLLGVSIGTIPTIAVAVQRPQDVNAVILDSPVALGELLRGFEWVLRDQTQTFIDLAPPELLSEELIGELPGPLLMFAGTSDKLTRFDVMSDLFDRAPEPKVLAAFPGVGHARARFDDTGRYVAELERFLSDVWAQRVPFAAVAAQQHSDGR